MKSFKNFLLESTSNIIFGGDIMFGRRFHDKYDSLDFNPLENIKSIFKDKYSVINFETAIDTFEYEKLDKIQLVSNESLIDKLKEAGIDCVSIANNHTMDSGIKNYKHALSLFKKNNIAVIGYDKKYVRHNGYLICSMLDDKYIEDHDIYSGANLDLLSNAKDMLDKLKKKYPDDKIICYTHCGIEYNDSTSYLKEMLIPLFEYGCDIIINGHPHIPIKTEIINRKPVCWSLGNLVFDQDYPVSWQAKLVELNINSGKLIDIPIEIEDYLPKFK